MIDYGQTGAPDVCNHVLTAEKAKGEGTKEVATLEWLKSADSGIPDVDLPNVWKGTQSFSTISPKIIALKKRVVFLKKVGDSYPPSTDRWIKIGTISSPYANASEEYFGTNLDIEIIPSKMNTDPRMRYGRILLYIRNNSTFAIKGMWISKQNLYEKCIAVTTVENVSTVWANVSFSSDDYIQVIIKSEYTTTRMSDTFRIADDDMMPSSIPDSAITF